MIDRRRLAVRALLPTMLALVCPAGTTAQQPATTPPQATSPYRIAGFRHARFGMNPAEVRAAIAADFGAAAPIATVANPAEGASALQTIVPTLEPGPGPATISYVFGATSKRLSRINVVWQTADALPAQREQTAAAAVQLTRYFEALPIRPDATVATTAIARDVTLMFAAVDKMGAAVELVVSGVGLQMNAAPAAPPPTGPAILRISYTRNAANPDTPRAGAAAR